MTAKEKKIAKWTFWALALLLALWWLFSPAGEQKAPQGMGGVNAEAPARGGTKRKIKYWVAPMDPSYRSNKPGKSPMGMDLVPVYEDEGSSSGGVVKIDPVTIQDIGVKTARVTKGPLTAEIRTVGRVTYNEEKVEHIHTRVSGWVERLFVDTTGQDVHKGQKLLTIYSPDLVETQQEYLQALRYEKETAGSEFKDISGGGKALIDATRTRLLLMGIRPGQIEALEKRGKVRNAMVLYSPIDGIVIDKKVLAGMRVTPGKELYELAGLSDVWIIGSIYEYELPFVKTGQEAQISLSYEPGVVYKGRISFIYPYLSADTRTAQVRIDFPNPGLKLKPDMYVNVYIKSRLSKDVLQVPSDAVIRTGTRNYVIAALGGGRFLPREVELGPAGQGMVEVRAGLSEGETIVTSGQFLIDSESNLREAVTRMEEAAPANGKAMKRMKMGAPDLKPGENAKPAGEKETPSAIR
ncbi:MAG: efflux RND transporter periplasmic adaptor subunit [Nitrospiraceae bacterium]|nr:efflux RND transporter periplasmic adaptor subunit [Nitrospiraceae bacterium]